MKDKQIVSLIESVLKEKLKDMVSFKDDELFIGYNPLQKLRGHLLHWVAVPFNGHDVWCQLRCPNGIQLKQCGDISNIFIDIDENKEFDENDLIQIKNYQEELCKITLNKPTYDQIAELVGKEDILISNKKKELEDIKEKFETIKSELSETEKAILDKKIRTIEMQIGYLLPDDTMAFIARWAMGNDISDIKKITKEMFLQAAVLAKAHGKSPSYYISGVLTDFNKQEIDSYAVLVLDEYMKDHKSVQDAKHNWFLGGRKNNGSMLPKRDRSK